MRALWAAVVTQAVLDATGRSSYNRAEYRRDGDPRLEAREWIEQGGPDFQAVCHAAGVCPDAVRDAVLNAPDRIGQIYLSSPPTRAKRSRTA
jgi:hypothetical protein